MKITLCLLFLEFLYVQSTYYTDGELKKYGTKRFTSNVDKEYKLRYVYVDLNDFKDEKTLYFIITIHYGYFSDNYVPYNFVNYESSTYLDRHATIYSESYGTRSTYTGYYYYDYHTYRIKIDKPTTSYRYLYIGTPGFSYYTGYYIEIENVSGFGLSVAVIIIIVIAVIAIAAASIVVYFCRRARRASYIAPPVAEYQPPVAAATAYPPPTYY